MSLRLRYPVRLNDSCKDIVSCIHLSKNLLVISGGVGSHKNKALEYPGRWALSLLLVVPPTATVGGYA